MPLWRQLPPGLRRWRSGRPEPTARMGTLCHVTVCCSVLLASQARAALAVPRQDCSQESEAPELWTPCAVPAAQPATSSLLQISSSSASSEEGPLLDAIWSMFSSKEHEESDKVQRVQNSSATNMTTAATTTIATGGDEEMENSNMSESVSNMSVANASDVVSTPQPSIENDEVSNSSQSEGSASLKNSTEAADATNTTTQPEEMENSNMSESVSNMSVANASDVVSTPRRIIENDEVSNSSQSEGSTSLKNSTEVADATNMTTQPEDRNSSIQTVSNMSASGPTEVMNNTERRVEGRSQSNSSNQSASNMSVTNATDVAVFALYSKHEATRAEEDLSAITVADTTKMANGTDTTLATRCPWKGLNTICTRNTSYYRAKLQPSNVPGREPLPYPSGDALEQKIKEYALTLQIPYSGDAMEKFQALQHLDARDVLAFQETWTQADTEILLSMDAEPEGFTTGNFSVKKFLLERLPQLSAFRALDFESPIAIVGAGPSVKGNGEQIDHHAVVARFNNHVGKELNSKDTGQRTTIHVINRWVKDMLQDPGLAMIINLECFAPGQEYCRYWHEEGKPPSVVGAGVPVLLIRPSILCAVPEITKFTRGFLFYHFVGRLFAEADLYGMAIEDLDQHYSKIKKHVGEPYLQFEHFVYAAAQGLKLEKRMELLRTPLEKKEEEKKEEPKTEGKKTEAKKAEEKKTTK